MSRRSRAREVALQALFQEDLNPQNSLDRLGAFLAGRLRDEDSRDFAKQIVLGVRRNQQELDALLAAKAENWSLHRMAATDRNILRIGAYEIRFSDTPPRVAIDEAVELAKRFGAAQSSQFVNGILDKLIERDKDSP
ncbi:MAG: transcription antitermination factor NusB [Pirellulales bacterium]|nr:transcription antitermination factor NusB [Pirellulales bacterium]MBX3433340.1 transcription antitermination factor NusB [Pirellulales bacterium]